MAPLIVTLEGEKYTVPAVFDEVVTKGMDMDYPDAVSTASLVDEGVLKVKAPQRKKADAITGLHKYIHAGEAEVIALAKEMNAIAVVDDRVARTVARIEGVRSKVPTASYLERPPEAPCQKTRPRAHWGRS